MACTVWEATLWCVFVPRMSVAKASAHRFFIVSALQFFSLSLVKRLQLVLEKPNS